MAIKLLPDTIPSPGNKVPDCQHKAAENPEVIKFSKYKRVLFDRLIHDSKAFKFDDLYKVEQEHANMIAACLLDASPLLFIETDVHLTSSYARFMYGNELELYREIKEINKATIYLYLNRDVPHVQDGSRLSGDDRNQLNQLHRQTLHHSVIKYYEIKGDWQERFKQAVDVIKSQVGILSEIYKVFTHFSKTAKSL